MKFRLQTARPLAQGHPASRLHQEKNLRLLIAQNPGLHHFCAFLFPTLTVAAPWGPFWQAAPFSTKGDSPSARSKLFPAQEQLLSGTSKHPISNRAESCSLTSPRAASVFPDRCRATQGSLLPATKGYNCQEEALQSLPPPHAKNHQS